MKQGKRLTVSILLAATAIAQAPAAQAQPDLPAQRFYQTAALIDKATAGLPTAEAPQNAVKQGARAQAGVTVPLAPDRTLGIGVSGTTSAASTPIRDASRPALTVYPNIDRDADAVTQSLPNGVRIMTLIRGSHSPKEYRFPVHLPAGFQLASDDNGGFEIVKPEQVGRGAHVEISFAGVKAPWAKDSRNWPVPVKYRVEGQDIVMSVEHKGASYPVVADPEYNWGIITGTAYYNRQETMWMRDTGYTIGIGAALTTAVGTVLGGPVGAVAANSVTGAWAAYVATKASNYYNDGDCIKIKLPYLGQFRHKRGARNCR